MQMTDAKRQACSSHKAIEMASKYLSQPQAFARVSNTFRLNKILNLCTLCGNEPESNNNISLLYPGPK